MADKLVTLNDLFRLQLQDLYNAENQLVAALPLLADNAKDARLEACFTKHLRETEQHVQRLERIGQTLGIELSGRTCLAMAGLVAEGQAALAAQATAEVLDAALLAAAQRIEHYEIASYGTAAHYAERLGHAQTAGLLRQTLEEEQRTDTQLNDLAKNHVNQHAH
jgi:ferritin-like metal-binding protein YciE